MKTIAFFNNKGGVGKTTIVYHLAWMLAEMGHRVIAADLDPQANLSAMFLHEGEDEKRGKLEILWENEKEKTIHGILDPLFQGEIPKIADSPHIELPLGESGGIGLLVGSFNLATLEGELFQEWNNCLAENTRRAFRITTSFASLIANAGREFNADLALVDVGPSLGALNRAALISSDYVAIPLAPDMFSMYGLRGVGQTLRNWRKEWKNRLDNNPLKDIKLPKNPMKPIGHIINGYKVVSGKVSSGTHLEWMERLSGEYIKCILGRKGGNFLNIENYKDPLQSDPNCLAMLQNFQGLMARAQKRHIPVFSLGSNFSEKIWGKRHPAVQNCYEGFRNLAEEILRQSGVKRKK